MKQAKWIWHPGDFELYHSMHLHNRRTKFGLYYPPMWRIDAPHSNVLLYRIVNLEKTENMLLAVSYVITGEKTRKIL